VQSPRTPCGGVCFEHAQNKRRGLAFAQRARQRLQCILIIIQIIINAKGLSFIELTTLRA